MIYVLKIATHNQNSNGYVTCLIQLALRREVAQVSHTLQEPLPTQLVLHI